MHMESWVDRNARWILPLPAVVFIIAMMLFPLAYTLWNSLTGWSLSKGTPATFIGLKNYTDLVADPRFLGATMRTFTFTAIAVITEVVLGVAIALLLNRPFKGRRIINSVMLLPMMATPVAIAMVWLLMMEPTAGIINYLLRTAHLPTPAWIAAPNSVLPSLALVDIWQWTPLVTLIVLAGLVGLPREPFEAAVVDGASSWQINRYITLPLLVPTISVAALLRLIDEIGRAHV